MLITRETDYALRVLRALVGGEQRTAGEIAADELVPKQFAYKIIKKLSKAGMVSITRGADGGCRLTADLGKVTLCDLMDAMEEDRAVTACMDSDYRCAWRERHGGCAVHGGLLEVQRALNRELKSHSLRELIFGGTDT